MEIERAWVQVPGWFLTQDAEVRARLMAWYAVHTSKGKKGRRRRKGADEFWGSR